MLLQILLLLVAGGSAAFAQASDLVSQIPSGDRWVSHLTTDLLPFWSSPAALGNPVGAFPSTRCDDGSVLDFQHPCAGIAGNSYLLAPDRYLVPLSRQTYGYGVAYHLTGDPKYLAWMKAGVDYIRQHTIDPAGGMFLMQDLNTGKWGPQRELRDPQQLGYGLLGMALYYYLTRDDAVLQDILTLKNYIIGSYYNPSLGAMQWQLPSTSRQLVADLDQMNTYLVLLAPILPEPSQTEWKQTLTTLSRSMLATFYSPRDNLLFTQADKPQDRDIALTGVDYGHTSKGLWMMHWTGLMTGDYSLANFAEMSGRKHLDRAYLADDGSWAGGVLPGGITDKNKNWWVYAELDQLSGTLALSDVAAARYLPQTSAYWFQYFVDHQYGEVWNGVNYGTNTPQRDFPKSWQWKSAYHDFEHVLVGYITAQALQSQPVKLHYAFQKNPDPVTIHPYYFSGTVDAMATTTDAAGLRYQTVTFHIPPPATAPPLTISSAASFVNGPFAAESIVTIFGTNLAAGTAQAVSVTDSKGTERSAPMFYTSPAQVNLEIPSGTQAGAAIVSVHAQDGTSIKTQIAIAGISPGVFQLSSSTALAAANVVRVRADATQSVEPVYQLDAANNVVPLPIDLSVGNVYLSLFCTGIRNAKSVSALVAGRSVPVLYYGSQSAYPGLDQVNIGPIPPSLAGSRRLNIVLAADGQTANPVELEVK
jgi:uncharacterized protein (TIGR03437 family)